MNTYLRRIVISTMIAIAAIASSATISHSQSWQSEATYRSMAECEARMQALLRAGRISAYKCSPVYRYVKQKPQQRQRLSQTRRINSNLNNIGVIVPKGWQRNHLIPDEVTRSNQLMIEARRRNLYDLDRASNILPMPSTAKSRKANPQLIGHQGSHNNYSNLINYNLERARLILIRKYGSLDHVPDPLLNYVIRMVENNARSRILNNNVPIRFDLKTRTKVLSDADLVDRNLVG
jgi:A nuclease family of the HNH/ENDO VII superfamily with conserved AHH